MPEPKLNPLSLTPADAATLMSKVSGGFNYASGRLDHQSYYKSVRVDQAFMASRILDPLLKAWLWEYGFIFGFPKALPTTRDEGAQMTKAESGSASALMPGPARAWFWDGMEHVDPAKEAKAQETRLRNNTTTLSAEYAKQGLDWEEALHQRARERKLMVKLGLTEAETAPESTQEEGEAHE